MGTWATVLLVVGIVCVLLLALSIRIVRQYEKGVQFRLGRLHGVREPGLRLIIPFVDVLRVVSLRTVTMPIQSQGIITKDNVSIDVAGVAYFHVVDAVKSVLAIESVGTAINQIAQTTLRNVVGQHTLDQTLAETDVINAHIREILDRTTTEWGLVVTLVELKDITLPESMKRAMARQAEAEREKRAKIIAAEGEAAAASALGEASDTMMQHPLALQLRNLQSLIEIGVDKNTTVVFPAPLMSTIGDLSAFLQRETRASEEQAGGGGPQTMASVAAVTQTPAQSSPHPASLSKGTSRPADRQRWSHSSVASEAHGVTSAPALTPTSVATRRRTSSAADGSTTR
jgi:regulator of protease activity HflC (stomatin/prohibitin superfamily)